VWGSIRSPHHFFFLENLMVKVLKEVSLEHWVGQPIDAIKKKLVKKEEPKFLEEQIRDYYPCDVEPKDEKNENI
jgi:ABC-type Zn2+ transport system substrate-binding protein/surface adhesin